MATAPTYCTHRQLKDVFPQVNSFDNKRAIYGWVSLGNNLYVANNTGLVTQLYSDGGKLNPIQVLAVTAIWSATLAANLDSQADGGASLFNTLEYNASFVAGSESDMGKGQYAAIGGEYVWIENVNTTTNKLAIRRGAAGTTIGSHSATDGVVNVGDFDEANEWFYDTSLDHIILYSATDPNDLLIEAGEDFSTLITRMTANASRYLDAKLDPNLPKEQLKDKEGNYDYIIVRTTALIAATFLIRSHDPTSEVASALMEDAMGNIDALNKGGAALSWQTTGDSSKGVIRDVGTISGALRPVDTRGRWSGSFDVIKVKIIDAGAIGTATYSVWTKGNDKLGANEGTQVVTAETIDGDYQTLAGGLEIRFSGSAYNSEASAGDTWEIEVAGWQEEVDNSTINSIKMTRGGTAVGRGKKKLGYNA